MLDNTPAGLREEILCKSMQHAEAGDDKSTALWKAAQEVYREALQEQREIEDIIENRL